VATISKAGKLIPILVSVTLISIVTMAAYSSMSKVKAGKNPCGIFAPADGVERFHVIPLISGWVNGPFCRNFGEEVGVIDLGIFRYAWSGLNHFDASRRFGEIEVNYRNWDSLDKPLNYLAFQIVGQPITGTVVFSDRSEGSVLSIFRPSTKNRQETLKLEYHDVQTLSDVIEDVTFISEHWQINDMEE
jgi:hypothetical protein